MKAYISKKYGSPDHLIETTVTTPIPKDNEVLVKVIATSINSADAELLKGIFLIRLGSPFRVPHKILGSDVSGIVEAVGEAVKKFKIGDHVYADTSMAKFGSFAEYVCVSEDVLRIIPKNISLMEAGAIPSAAVLAYQGLHDLDLDSKKVLINGAGGGMGTFAIQIAKAYHAEVTAVDNKHKINKLLELGADYALDYQKVDFTEQGITYDIILDCYGTRNMKKIKKSLKEDGKYILVGGKTKTILQAFLASRKKQKPIISVLMAKYNNQEYLDAIEELIQQKKVRPIIDDVYKFSNLVEAFHEYNKNTFFGKIVIVHDAYNKE